MAQMPSPGKDAVKQLRQQQCQKGTYNDDSKQNRQYGSNVVYAAASCGAFSSFTSISSISLLTEMLSANPKDKRCCQRTDASGEANDEINFIKQKICLCSLWRSQSYSHIFFLMSLG